MDEIYIQHRFRITADDGSLYSDAITLPQSEYEALSDKDIEDIKKERLDNWMAFKAMPPSYPDPEQIQELQNSLQSQLDEISSEVE